MAMTVTARGTYTNNTAATTSTLSPSGNFASGSFAVLVIAADNSSAAGSSNDINSVTDSLGNTWTKRNSAIFDNGAASAGVQGSTFTTPMDKSPLTTGTTITITFGTSPTADCGCLWEITPSAGWQTVYGTGAVGTGATTASPTVTTSSINSGTTLIGCLYAEAGTEQTVTDDSDVSSGTWGTGQKASIGSTTSGMTVHSQYKVTTGTATQTFNPTMNNSVDCITSWITIFESAIPKHPGWDNAGWW